MPWVKGCCAEHEAAGVFRDPDCPGTNIMVENLVCGHCKDRVPVAQPAPYNSVAGFAGQELQVQRPCSCGALAPSETASP